MKHAQEDVDSRWRLHQQMVAAFEPIVK